MEADEFYRNMYEQEFHHPEYHWNDMVGKESEIQYGVLLNYDTLTNLRKGYKPHPPKIGENCLIRTNAVIYPGCKLGDNVRICHNVILREFTVIDNDSYIGNNSCCEGYTKIGKNVAIHTQVHLTAKMIIEDDVFIGPNVTTTNGKIVSWQRPHLKGTEKGPTIRRGAVIGGGATLLPGVEIGEGAVIGAGSVVTKDIPPFKISVGNPARILKDVPKEQRIQKLMAQA